MSKTFHMGISVRGMLHWPDREIRRLALGKNATITKDDGSRFASVAEFRNMLMDELSRGHEVLPLSNPPCEGFDYKAGCPGHESQE